jgi:hypothetical protein
MLLDPAWFLAGLAIGLIVIGFLALGSYDRGYARARDESLRAELHGRHPIRMTTVRRAADALRRQAEGP